MLCLELDEACCFTAVAPASCLSKSEDYIIDKEDQQSRLSSDCCRTMEALQLHTSLNSV